MYFLEFKILATFPDKNKKERIGKHVSIDPV